jgi:tetratricopeptide (TPR) repeat protein
MEDLEEAIACHRQGLDLCPAGHPDRSLSLHNLANAVYTRFQQVPVRELADVEEAIAYHRQALDLRPPGHPDRSSSLQNLATAISVRFDELAKMEDLEESVKLYFDADSF